MASPISESVLAAKSLESVDRLKQKSIHEIKERVTKAATEGLSKMAIDKQITLIRPTKATETTTLDRPRTVWNFHNDELFPLHKLNIPSDIPASAQERVLIDEVLHCLVGIRGTYITPIDGSSYDLEEVKFRISDKIDESLRGMVQEMLPLASHYSILQRFSQNTNAMHSGQILQALGASIQNLLYDYYVFLVQLESEYMQCSLTLQKLLFFINPTIHIFKILADAVKCIRISHLRGAQILSFLYNKIGDLSGDVNSKKIITHITETSAVPYIDMLQLWILKGVILDPYQEFLVVDNEIIHKDAILDHYSAEYWEKRYTIQRDRVPTFFEDLSDIILRAGKYLNVIRQCGVSQLISRGHDDEMQFSTANPSNHTLFIQNAYTFAARTLLKVLVQDNDLMGHLLSVKRYLLLHQGDFINQFMDASEKELVKNVDKILPMRLENLLGLSLRLSSTKYDKYNDDLHCQLFPFELVKQIEKIILAGSSEEDYWQDDKIHLSGLECFAFRYEVRWPVSLVLNHFAILEYQILFRQLFYCKHTERQLCKVWKDNNNAKKFAPEFAELYRSAFTLRQRMMNAIQNLEYYMMIEVIEPTWHDFVGKMEKVSNVDEVLLVHQDFLDDCLYNCMLKTPELVRSVVKLCNICLSFCKFIQKAQQYFVDAELTAMLRSDESSDSDSEVDLLSNKQQVIVLVDGFVNLFSKSCVCQ